MATVPEKRAVAGSFIFRLSPEGRRPQVALFRRSAEVRTYRHRYAPISGSVEADDADALTTAWRELAEETGLGPSSLRLLRQGKPYSFVDEAVGREWTINPFAFALRTDGPGEAAIKLDREHESFAWFDPAEIPEDDNDGGDIDATSSSFRGVPHLLDSLRRVWFELELRPAAAAAVLDDGLRRLRDDHTSGARQLASVALDTLIRVLPVLHRPPNDSARWWRSLRIAAWHLWKNGREAMGASILRLLLDALTLVETKLPPDGTDSLPDGFIDNVLDALQGIAQRRLESGAALQEAFASFVRRDQATRADTSPIRIISLSSSATVASCLDRALAQGLALDVHVLESRPLFEGASMARAIAASIRAAGNLPGASVSVHTDASVALAARGANILLLGADLIDASGNVSNKTGSLPAVLAVRHVAPAVKVVVVAESEKVLPLDSPSASEDNNPDQVSRAWADDDRAATQAGNVHLSNVYFEWVPAGLIDSYITEAGVATGEDIAGLARDARARLDRFFSNL